MIKMQKGLNIIDDRHILSSPAAKVCGALSARGFMAYIVGGAIRDAVLKREPKDWDVATNATPREVGTVFERVIPTGEQYGTVTVISDDELVEVTTFRKDGAYQDGRRPVSVEWSDNIEDDLARRDFTMNALAYDPTFRCFKDPFHGCDDVLQQVIRTVGNAEERFNEDALRMMRALRFYSTLPGKWSLDPSIKDAIMKLSANIRNVSIERIRDELNKMLVGENVFNALQVMQSTGLMARVLPDLQACVGVDQNKFHAHDVFYHIAYAVSYIRPELHLRLSAMLHDIAKPQSLSVENGERHFYRHEYLGAIMAERIMKYLKYSNDIIAQVHNLVSNHMFSFDASIATDRCVRRLISKVGRENIYDLIELRKADQRASKGRISQRTVELEQLVHEELNRPDPLKLAINGNFVMQILGIPEGREVGRVLSYLKEKVLDDPSLNNHDDLATLVMEWKGDE
jgi:tRNA nucleotidyltransferase (CCA-adding enzyme)